MPICREDLSHPEESEEKLSFRPCIVVLAGLPLSGKSAIGNELSRHSNLVLLDVDEARIEVFGESRTRLDDNGEQLVMQLSYQRNHERAQKFLSEGKPVILAATYSRDIYHEMVKVLSKKTKTPLRVFFLDPEITEDDLKSRIQKRKEEGSFSNLTSFDHYLSVKNRYRLIQSVNLIRIDTKLPIQNNVQQIFEALSDLRQDSSEN